MDKDPSAIAHARREYPHLHIRHHCADAVRDGFPAARYDAVIWSEGLDHLSAQECGVVLARIQDAIGDEGVLVGGLILVPPERLGKANWEHQNEFSSPEAVQRFLGAHFAEVSVECTEYPEKLGGTRRTAYFTARLPRRAFMRSAEAAPGLVGART